MRRITLFDTVPKERLAKAIAILEASIKEDNRKVLHLRSPASRRVDQGRSPSLQRCA